MTPDLSDGFGRVCPRCGFGGERRKGSSHPLGERANVASTTEAPARPVESGWPAGQLPRGYRITSKGRRVLIRRWLRKAGLDLGESGLALTRAEKAGREPLHVEMRAPRGFGFKYSDVAKSFSVFANLLDNGWWVADEAEIGGQPYLVLTLVAWESGRAPEAGDNGSP